MFGHPNHPDITKLGRFDKYLREDELNLSSGVIGSNRGGVGDGGQGCPLLVDDTSHVVPWRCLGCVSWTAGVSLCPLLGQAGQAYPLTFSVDAIPLHSVYH